MNKEYGPIANLPGIFDRTDTTMSYRPSDYEKVFRVETNCPERPGFDIVKYYRYKLRSEIFNGNVGLILENGDQWAKVRAIVNPIMLLPRNVKLHISAVDKVTNDFLVKIVSKRDGNNEVPDDSLDELNLWIFESIGVIALGQRLDVLSDTDQSKETKYLINSFKDFFFTSNEIEFSPLIWKYYKTQKFRKLIKAFDNMTLKKKKSNKNLLLNLIITA